jgi:hypothetical protein
MKYKLIGFCAVILAAFLWADNRAGFVNTSRMNVATLSQATNAPAGETNSFLNPNEVAGLFHWFQATNFTNPWWVNSGAGMNFYSAGMQVSNNVQNGFPAVFAENSWAADAVGNSQTFSNYAYVFVGKLIGTQDEQDILIGSYSVQGSLQIQLYDTSKLCVQFNGTNYGSWTYPDRFFVYGILRTGTNLVTATDTGVCSTNHIEADSITSNFGWSVAAAPNGTATTKCWVSEALVYTNSVSVDNLVSVMNGLTNKYAIHP